MNYDSSTSPFKLLDPYTIEDKDIFFGREEEIDALYQLVFESNLILIYGPSGAGKTSLVQCGLAGRFEKTDWFDVYVRRRGNINRSLRRAIKKKTKTSIPAGKTIKESVESLFLDFFRPIYLIFDQFEELYILGSPSERRTLIRNIASLIHSGLSVKVLVIMREEYIAHLNDFEEQVPEIFEKRIRIEPMKNRHVREVVEGSCRHFGIRLRKPKTTVKKIIDNVSDRRGRVQLSHLQLYLDRLYQEARFNV